MVLLVRFASQGTDRMSDGAVGAARVAELEIRNLVRRYTAQSVVGPLSFSVAAGEFISLLGPSGCGKTTTLRCIAGFETPDEGGIFLEGERIDRQPPNRRNIGLVFQSYALFPHLTIFENVAFGLRLRRLPSAEIKQRVGDALNLVGLADLAERYPRQLSGGQQQRIAIARSVVLEPRILMFDEPLSNLDFKLRVTMRNELRELQRRLGKTAIYVTHDQSEALALSDRIVVMSNGRIEQIGPPREIYERPANAFVADFIGNSNLLDAVVVTAAPDATTVRTARGLTLRAAPAARQTGNRVVVMIRPEHVRLGPGGGSSGDNAMKVRVKEATYLGQDLHLRVVSGEQSLAVMAQASALRHLKVGDEIDAAIAVADVLLLPA
jgi:spermidine/putrescine ABC transporter ATP-binding subunit